MSGLTWYGTSFDYVSLGSVTDVQTVINSLRTSLTSTLPAADRWTESPTGTFKTPPDLRGRFYKIAVAKTTATRMAFQVFDQDARQIVNGEIQIAGAGSTVNIYTGPYHVFIEANNAGTWEFARACMSDPRPEALDAHPIWTFGYAHRDSAGNLTGFGDKPGFWSFLTIGGTLQSTAEYVMHPCLTANDSTNAHLMTESGADVAIPVEACTTSNVIGGYFVCGKLFQLVFVSHDQAPGVSLSIPIDSGVTGNFQVTQMTVVGCSRLAVRRT